MSVQFHVLPDKVYEAFYKLNDADTQIKAYVFDVVRARVPRIKLDELFEKKDEIAKILDPKFATPAPATGVATGGGRGGVR